MQTVLLLHNFIYKIDLLCLSWDFHSLWLLDRLINNSRTWLLWLNELHHKGLLLINTFFGFWSKNQFLLIHACICSSSSFKCLNTSSDRILVNSIIKDKKLAPKFKLKQKCETNNVFLKFVVQEIRNIKSLLN